VPVAKRVRELRERLKLSQTGLARLAELTRGEVNALEHGKNKATSVRVQWGLAKAAGVSSDDMRDYLEAGLPLPEHLPGASPPPTLVQDRVQELRELLGFTQANLARRSGLTKAEVHALEHGRNQGTSARVQEGLAKTAGVERDRLEDYLLGRLSLEKLIPHQPPLEKILEAEPDRWHEATIAAATELSRQGLDLSPLEWGYRLDAMQKALLPVIPKQQG